jgi:hypothetical protein
VGRLVAASSRAGGAGGAPAIPNIPPFVANWAITAIQPVREDITIYGYRTHMHWRGKDMKIVAIFPDGRETTLLNVPNYNFEWQTAYELETPAKIPAGSKLMAIGHFDNSANNKNNPAPEKEVFWSEQTWDEMFNGMLSYSVDSRTLQSAPRGSQQQP